MATSERGSAGARQRRSLTGDAGRPILPSMARQKGGDVVAQKLETDRGKLSIWLPAPGIVAHCFVGHFDVEFASAVIAVHDKVFSRPGPIVFFNDWEGMSAYDSDARVLATEWVHTHRQRIVGVHVLVQSRLVGMGVSVASLMLGGILTSYTDREAWEVALREQVQDRGRTASVRPEQPGDKR